MRKSTETLLSQRLKELRADKGITQKQLASEIGVSYGSIVDYENGRREPNSKAMAALERYFRVSGEYLRGEVDRATFLQNSATIQDRLDGWWVCSRLSSWNLTAAPRSGRCWPFPSCPG